MTFSVKVDAYKDALWICKQFACSVFGNNDKQNWVGVFTK